VVTELFFFALYFLSFQLERFFLPQSSQSFFIKDHAYKCKVRKAILGYYSIKFTPKTFVNFAFFTIPHTKNPSALCA
jgi:hypothetical protein